MKPADPTAEAYVESMREDAARNGNRPIVDAWPAPAVDAAFTGPAGMFVERVAPQSEADPHALLAHYLAAAGNLFGPDSYYQVEGDRHPARLFVAIVGSTSKARKGTAWSRMRQVANKIDPEWAGRVGGGLSSGEGPLWHVRDPITRMVPIIDEEAGKRGKPTGRFEEQVEDPGIADKRLLVVEAELSRHFDVIARQGNTLSETLRRLWDGGVVSSLTKNNPVKSTNPHVSVIGHISREELQRKATGTEFANGFLNRFLIVAARRSQELPFGGDLDDDDLVVMQEDLHRRVYDVRSRGERRISWSKEARDRWKKVYGELSAERPGMVGAVVARAEAQVVRLAVCYALLEPLLDDAPVIDLPHLEAALAFWDYCARSAEWAFGDTTGDPTADLILLALRQAGENGLTRTDIRDLLSRNHPEQIPIALTVLAIRGLARMEREETGGRPAERWWSL